MKPVQRIALVGLVLVALLVAFLALRSRQPPILPQDADHASFASGGTCLRCHGLDGPTPRSKNHPLGDDCLRCHGLPK